MEVIENGILIGSINGTVFGGAGLVVGKKGLTLYTNGVDQYVDLCCQGNTCPGSISLCAHGWVSAFWRQPTDDPTGIIMDVGLYGYERVVIFVYNFVLMARFSSPDKFWEVSIRLPPQQVWVHIVLTWQSRYGVKLYIDGGLAVRDTSPSNPTMPFFNMPRFVLGTSNKYQSMYEMTLGELRVWDTVMHDEDVSALYTVDAAGLN